jgi:hypothetical protein
VKMVLFMLLMLLPCIANAQQQNAQVITVCGTASPPVGFSPPYMNAQGLLCTNSGFIQCGSLIGANMNVTTDQAIAISVPSVAWVIQGIYVSNPSVSLTTSAGGIYTAASKGGTAIVDSSQAYSGLTSHTANTAGNFLSLTLASAVDNTQFSSVANVFLSLTTPQGSAATADFRVFCTPLN